MPRPPLPEPTDGTLISRILMHVRSNPGVYTPEIVQNLSIKVRTVSMALTRLQDRGLIYKSREDRKANERTMRWYPGKNTEAPISAKNIKMKSSSGARVKVVQKWPSHPVRDPLTAALFGPSIQQGE